MSVLEKANLKVAELFLKKAGDRREELLALAEEFHDACEMSPERALAEALHARPVKQKKQKDETYQ